MDPGHLHSNRFPGGTDAAGMGNTVRTPQVQTLPVF